MGLDLLRKFGLAPLRVLSGRGVKPHLSLSFNDSGGKEQIFSIDTTPFSKKMRQPDCYLVTHAHSDHYGKSAMKSKLSAASTKTATALEILHDNDFNGQTFELGEHFFVGDTRVSTFATGHTVGSTGYLWENENGVRILVTGDVKDYTGLPQCDVLITEANYGDPQDSACYFEDDVPGFQSAVDGGEVVFGAYAFGKAQRAVSMLRDFGFDGAIGMTPKSLELTRTLLHGAGELVDMNAGAEVCIATPHELSDLASMRRFILTGRSDYYYPTIHISDHMDVRGLLSMVEHCQTEAAIIYHPRGDRPKMLAEHLNDNNLCHAIATEDITPVTLK